MTQDNRKTIATFVSFTPNATVPKNGGGTYQAFILTATVNGEVKNWTKPASALKFNKGLERQLKALVGGSTISIMETKNDKGFVEITGVHTVESGLEDSMSLGGNSAPAPSATSKGTSTTTNVGNRYETEEERKARQVYIVRQSSLERALQLAELQGNKKVTPNEVMATATTFVNYVFGNGAIITEEEQVASPTIAEDDVPY